MTLINEALPRQTQWAFCEALKLGGYTHEDLAASMNVSERTIDRHLTDTTPTDPLLSLPKRLEAYLLYAECQFASGQQSDAIKTARLLLVMKQMFNFCLAERRRNEEAEGTASDSDSLKDQNNKEAQKGHKKMDDPSKYKPRYKRFDGPDYGKYTSAELDAALDDALAKFTAKYNETKAAHAKGPSFGSGHKGAFDELATSGEPSPDTA